jgi:hypothetical protein
VHPASRVSGNQDPQCNTHRGIAGWNVSCSFQSVSPAEWLVTHSLSRWSHGDRLVMNVKNGKTIRVTGLRGL